MTTTIFQNEFILLPLQGLYNSASEILWRCADNDNTPSWVPSLQVPAVHGRVSDLLRGKGRGGDDLLPAEPPRAPVGDLRPQGAPRATVWLTDPWRRLFVQNNATLNCSTCYLCFVFFFRWLRSISLPFQLKNAHKQHSHFNDQSWYIEANGRMILTFRPFSVAKTFERSLFL